MNAPAPIGHNRPLDPFEAFSLELDSLFEEAENYLDGAPIENDDQARDVSAILDRLRKASTDADKQRKAEKKPHDDAAAAVQSKWNPILNRARLAAETAKIALAAFLTKKEAAERAAAEALRQEAEEKARVAAQLSSDIAPDNLAGQKHLRAAREEAAAIAKEADRADKRRAQAKGGERAVSLRSHWRAELADPAAFGRWAWEHRRPDYLAFLADLAARECRHGPKDIPGIIVHEERKAV